MNRKHVSKVGKYISVACLLLVCTVVQSCRDEYYFDDTKPPFVGPSIYEYLESKGDFTYFLRVIDDLDYAEVLRQTGSKTLFVADDKAFMAGIKDRWQITRYEDLSMAQKKMILYGAMLDNAYLLEMLSKMQSTGANAEPIPGQCLRRVTSASVTDTIGLFPYKDLPQNNKEWNKFESDSVRLALDASQTMMTHFIREQLYMKNIGERDLQILVGNPSASLSDIFIYGEKVIKELSDVTCKNGYVHQLDGLLIPPSNMAEELRKNVGVLELEGTSIQFDNPDAVDTTTLMFSRMLDRFAVPVPISANSEIAQNFNRIYGVEEKLYEKKYYVKGSFTSYEDEDGAHNALATLLFDPGWNAYKSGSTDKEQDMAAILAPSDKAVIEYFVKGAGRTLFERFAKALVEQGKDIWNVNDALLEAIDSIPVDILEPLVRNHMKMSFNSTVPSKFEYIVDEGTRDPMKVDEKDVKKVMLANNGVVYVMDTLYSPAEYNSVVAPVKLSDSLNIFYKAIKDLQYDKYLLSMGNKFGLMVTGDNYVVYYDPYTERKNIAHDYVEKKDPKGYNFVATKQSDGSVVVKAKEVKYDRTKYDPATNTYGVLTETKGTDGVLNTLFKEILEYNIVLGDINSEKDCKDGKQYYMSKGYGTVKVKRGAGGQVTHIAGGRELQNETMIPVEKTDDMTNGYTFQLKGSMIQPPTQTVYDVLANPEFASFSTLCSPSETVLKYFLGEDGKTKKSKEWNKYEVYYDQIAQHRLVRLFDTYHYTVYVPSNDAMERAHNDGLPTWADLEKQIEEFDEEPNDSLRQVIKSGADLISKFVRYHFQDNAVYVDSVPHALEVDKGNGLREYEYKVDYETSAWDEAKNKFRSLLVQTEVDPNTNQKTIAVRGDFGKDEPDANVCYVVRRNEHELYNVMTRDIEYSGGNVFTSSYAVVHLIDNFLVYDGIYNPAKFNPVTNKNGMFVR